MKKFLNPSRLRLPSVSGNKSGFTLVEILAAITIVGILYLIYTIFFTLSPKPEDLTNKGTVFAAKLASTYTTARQDESLSMDSTAFNDAVTTFAGGKKTIGAMKTACMTNPVFETSGLCASLESVLKIWPNARFEVKPVTFATVQAAYLNDAGTVKL